VSVRAVFIVVLVASGLMQAVAHADETPVEIDYLLTTMGSSDCTFIRNGTEYSAADAEAHLRMKYGRGKRYASTTEDFIENLASQSSMSKEPYFIACNGDEKMESGTWLMRLLLEHRATEQSSEHEND